MTVDAIRLADKADHIILFSGEQSFASLVSALQQLGKRVTVISTIETQPAMVADELRRQADHFLDIDSLQAQIARQGRTPRPAGFEREDRFRRSHGEDDRVHAERESDAMETDSTAQRDGLAHDDAEVETLSDEGQTVGEATTSDEAASAAASAPLVRTTVRRRRTQA